MVVSARKGRSIRERRDEPNKSFQGQEAGPTNATSANPRSMNAKAEGNATGLIALPYRTGTPRKYPIEKIKPREKTITLNAKPVPSKY